MVCRLDALSPEVDFSVIRTSVPSVLYIMCSSEASISQIRSDMFKSLSSFTGLYIEKCQISFMHGSFLLGLKSLEQLEIKQVDYFVSSLPLALLNSEDKSTWLQACSKGRGSGLDILRSSGQTTTSTC